MKYEDISHMAPINGADETKVLGLASSMLEDGWQGSPILVHEKQGMLITGSHRLAALRLIEQRYRDGELTDEQEQSADRLFDTDLAEDVSDIVDDWCESHDCTIDDIPFDSLGDVFAGTEIEDYKDTIEEW